MKPPARQRAEFLPDLFITAIENDRHGFFDTKTVRAVSACYRHTQPARPRVHTPHARGVSAPIGPIPTNRVRVAYPARQIGAKNLEGPTRIDLIPLPK